MLFRVLIAELMEKSDALPSEKKGIKRFPGVL